MRNCTQYIACLAVALTACRHAAPDHVIDSNSSTAVSAASEPHPVSLIVLTGGHDSTCGRWRVNVSDEDASLRVSRLSGKGSTTINPQNWKAAPGAFIYVEGVDRVWAYDGRSDLFMLSAAAETLISYGPSVFPCKLPKAVRARLPERMAQTIQEEIRIDAASPLGQTTTRE